MQARTRPLDRSRSGSTSFDIPRLLQQAESGVLRVPTFQRSFVWDAGDVRQLFDSIYRGFPLGTLLLWQRPVPQEVAVFGPLRIAAEASNDGLVVVDGQQRITSLVASLSAHTKGMDDRFEVFFDLARQRFVGLVRGVPPRRAIPVRELLESRRLLAWLRENDDDLEPEDLETADELSGAIRDYRISAYIVEGDDEALLREVFDRVNSAGKPMTRAQVFHALFAHDSQPGSPATVAESLSGLKFGSIPENRVVQSILAVRGGDVQRDLHDEFSSTEDVADWYEQTEHALRQTLVFLQNEGVVHQILMPSSFPLPVLAAFFHLHPSPDRWVATLLSRWLWRGWVHGFGREAGQTPTLRRAVRSVNPVKGEPGLAPGEYEAVQALLEVVDDSPALPQQPSVFRTDNASARIVLLALAALEPLSPTGEKMHLPEELNSHGPAAAGELVTRHRRHLGARGFWLPDWPPITGAESSEVLRSHAVPTEAADALLRGDVDGFVEIRGLFVANLVAKFLNSRLAPGVNARPPLSSLLVPDPLDQR